MLSQYWRQKKYEGYFLEDAYLWCDRICMPSSLQTYHEKLLTRQWSGIFLILQSLDIQLLPHTDSALSLHQHFDGCEIVSACFQVSWKKVCTRFFFCLPHSLWWEYLDGNIISLFSLNAAYQFSWNHQDEGLMKHCLCFCYHMNHQVLKSLLETNVSFSLHQNYFVILGN